MEQAAKKEFLALCKISGPVFLSAGLLLAFMAPAYLVEYAVSYGLTFLFVAGNFGVAGKIGLDDHKKFYRIFLISLALRFLLVIGALIFVLKALNFHQIFFTVSFIISYIFHSVMEIILINKLLETDREG